MYLGTRQRKFMSTAHSATTGEVTRMGICYRPEASLGEVSGSSVLSREAIHLGARTEPQFGISADGEAVRDEWTQPRLSGDAQQRILALYDEYRPHLYRYLRSMRLGREWAEEVIQETFMRLTSKLLEKDDIENVQGWVVRVAHNLAVDVLKEECRKIIGDDEPFLIENRADPSLNPEEAYCRNERSIRMTLALWELKPQHRQCFQMRAHGFRYKDIGVALGISAQRAAFVVKQVAMRLATICG